MAFPNPLTLELEIGGLPVPSLVHPTELEIEFAGEPVVNLFTLGALSLEVEFAGSNVRSGQEVIPNPDSLRIETQTLPIPGVKPPPFRLEFEYTGGSLPLNSLGKPAPQFLEVEYLGVPITPPAARPSMVHLEFEVFQPTIAVGLVSALYDVESAVLTTMSKATYVDVPVSSNIFPRNLAALAVVSGHGYFSNPANWAALFTVYLKQGTPGVSFFARHTLANEIWPGEFILRSVNPEGVYDKCVLLEGNDGTTLVVPNTDINEPLTIIA